MSTPTISRSTGITISIAFLISMLGMAYMVGAKTTGLEGQVNRNTSDVTNIMARLDTLNENLVTTNGNIIQLNARLDGLVAQITRVTVAKPTPAPRVVVLASQGPTQPITPANQPPKNDPPANPQPADPPEQAPVLPCTLLPILCNQGRLL